MDGFLTSTVLAMSGFECLYEVVFGQSSLLGSWKAMMTIGESMNFMIFGCIGNLWGRVCMAIYGRLLNYIRCLAKARLTLYMGGGTCTLE